MYRVLGEEEIMRDTNNFAWRLRQARYAMGITQFEMCDRVNAVMRKADPDIGISYPAYNKYETGDTATPKIPVLSAIAEVLNLSLDYLISGHEEEEAPIRYWSEDADYIAQSVDALPDHLRKNRPRGHRPSDGIAPGE